MSEKFPTLLFLHGLYGTTSEWRPLESALRSELSPQQVDCQFTPLPNHRDGKLIPQPTADVLARYVSSLLDSLPPHPLTLVGHSAGGRLAYQMARLNPNRVERLVVLDAMPPEFPLSSQLLAHHRHIIRILLHSRSLEGAPRSEMRTFLRASIPDLTLVDYLLKNYVRRRGQFQWAIGIEGIACYVETLSSLPSASPEIRHPILLIRSAHSGYCPDRQLQEFRRYAQKLCMITLSHDSHALHTLAPHQVAPRIAEFLRGTTCS